MRVHKVAVRGEEYAVAVAGIRLPRPVSVEELLRDAKSVGESTGAVIALVRPDAVATEVHCVAAAKYALRSFAAGTNVARDLGMEALLYMSGTRQIRDALRLVGLPSESLALVAVAISRSEEAAREAVARLAELSGGELDEGLLEVGPEKAATLMRAFSISEGELSATVARSREEALVKCVLSRMALLHLRK